MEIPDSNLVQKCLQGDNLAFDALVRRNQQQVYALCCRMLGDRDEAADVTQESFVKAYIALESFKPDNRFLSWLFRIANNTCIDAVRRRARRGTVSLEDLPVEHASDERSPEDVTLCKESDRLVGRALMGLPEKYRAPLVMFHYHGMSVADISQTLNRPVGTVKSDLHHAREMLRRKLEGVVVEV